MGICRKQHLSRIWYLALRIPAPLGAFWQPGVCRKGKYFPTWSLVFGLFILLRCWSRAALLSACSRQCGSKVFLLPDTSTTHQRRNLPERDAGSETCALQTAEVARPQSILCISSLKRLQRAPVGDPVTPIVPGKAATPVFSLVIYICCSPFTHLSITCSHRGDEDVFPNVSVV